MESKKRVILVINVSVIFIITAILAMTLHEWGHFIAGLVFGVHPVLYHNYVGSDREGVSLFRNIIIAGAGPFVSLLIGIFFSVLLRQKKQADIIGLFLVFMSVFGYEAFFGYIAIAPEFSNGDTGFVLRAIGCPLWLIYTLSWLSIAGLFFILKGIAPYFVSFMSKETAEDKSARKKFIIFLIVIPIMICIPIFTLLNLPVPTLLSLMYPIFTPLSIFWVYYYFVVSKPKNWGYSSNEIITQKIPIVSIIALVILIIINRLLVFGFSI